MKPTRRKFMGMSLSAALASWLGPELWAEALESTKTAGDAIPHRPLGKTGEHLSVVGFGGIIVIGHEQKECNEMVAKAFDRGVNYYDVAPTYGAGEAETKLGPALVPYRDKVFLACKTQKRDKAGAMKELEESLKRLKTDHVDLYQLHAITDPEKDVDAAMAPGGAMEAFEEAKEKGMIRYFGFSAHSVEAALRAIGSGRVDTMLYPTNFACHYAGNGFDEKPIAAAEKNNVARLAIKTIARQRWPQDADRSEYPKAWYQPIKDPVEAALALRWTLGRGVTAAIPPGDYHSFQLAMNVASKQQTLNEQETEALKKLAETLNPVFTAKTA